MRLRFNDFKEPLLDVVLIFIVERLAFACEQSLDEFSLMAGEKNRVRSARVIFVIKCLTETASCLSAVNQLTRKYFGILYAKKHGASVTNNIIVSRK